MEALRRGDRARGSAVHGDGALGDPARDADVVCEGLAGRDRGGERVAEWIEGVNGNGDGIIWDARIVFSRTIKGEPNPWTYCLTESSSSRTVQGISVPGKLRLLWLRTSL
jgi:hypothetical protein